MKIMFTAASVAAISLFGTTAMASGPVYDVVPAPVVIETANYGNVDFVGSAEYAVEAERFETQLGIEYTYNQFSVRPVLVGEYVNSDFNFVGAEIGVIYNVNSNVNFYGSLDFDQDFDYSEATVGVAFRF